MRIFIIYEYVFILLNIALRALVLVSESFLLYIIYNVLLAISTVYYITSYIYNRRVSSILALTVTAFIPIIFDAWQRGEVVLVWDHKAQENIALFIAQEGRIPEPLNGIYRIEYVSYPAGFILWSILSQVTCIPTNTIMTAPLLTIALYILFLWVICDLLKHNNISFALRILMVSILMANFIANYRLSHYFIYQNFGRVLLLTTVYVIYKYILIYIKYKYIPLIIFAFTLIFTHSESSTALVLILIGMCLSYLLIVLRDVQRFRGHKELLIIFFLTIIAFLIYTLWFITSFTANLLDMLRNIVRSLLVEEEVVPKGVTKFTPWDYTVVELALYIASMLCLGIIASINTIIALITYIRKGQAYVYLGPLIVIGISFSFLTFLTPFKSDIAFKFLTSLAIMASLSLMELATFRSGRCGYGQNTRLTLFTIVLILASILMNLGYFIISNRGDFSEISRKAYETVQILEISKIEDLVKKSSYTRIVILDTPTLPYYFVHSYLVPRIAREYFIIPLDPNLQHYSYRLINGLQYPRFVLAQHTPLLDQWTTSLSGSLIIGDVKVIADLARTSNLHIIYQNSRIGIGLGT